MSRWIPIFLVGLLLAGCGDPTDDTGTTQNDPGPEPEPRDLRGAYDRALDALTGKIRDDGFIHFKDPEPGVTALVLAGFVRRPGGIRPKDRALVDRVCDALVETQKDDGGIYVGGLANYTTCAAVLALKAANRDKDASVVERAVLFLKGLQFAENRGVDPGRDEYGGLGYGTHERPDLSNTQYNLEALRAGGVAEDDPVFKKVLAFLQRTQNRTESNPGGAVLEDGRRVTPTDDGGAGYRPAESKAGVVELPDGTVALRSYGSMTYALLKCYILAGLSKDDPRVTAAFRWVKANWGWDENPGFRTPEEAQQGLYYYYAAAAQALALLEVGVVEIDGEKRDWRKELSAKLLALQKDDGTWENPEDRWYEGTEVATAHALVALAACIAD